MYITNWVREKKIRFLKSKFLVFLLGGAIIGSSIIIYYEGIPLYRYIREGYQYSTTFLQIQSYQGSLAPAGEYQDERESMKGVSLKDPSPSKTQIEKVVKAIHKVETNYGTDLSGLHGKCVAEGKDNSYSYSPGKCYTNEQETKEIVIEWFERKTKEMTIESALCLYGPDGKPLETCAYAKGIINLI
jgi:hypothetical protein